MPSQRFHNLVSCAVIIIGIPTVCMRALVCYIVQLAQGAVFDKVGFTATLEATFVPDDTDGTIGCNLLSGGATPKSIALIFLFLVLLYNMTKHVFQVLDPSKTLASFNVRVLHTLNGI